MLNLFFLPSQITAKPLVHIWHQRADDNSSCKAKVLHLEGKGWKKTNPLCPSDDESVPGAGRLTEARICESRCQTLQSCTPRDKLGLCTAAGTQRCSEDGQDLVKPSTLSLQDSKFSSNVIPVILGHSWFSSSSQIRLRQNLLMILKAVAIPLTPILWVDTLGANTFTLHTKTN